MHNTKLLYEGEWVKVAQLCPTLCEPKDYVILQAM